MINGFHLRRVLRTHPAGFAFKFLFIRVIRVIRGFNFGSWVEQKAPPINREQAKGTKKEIRFLAVFSGTAG
jgi:hypothetical protein